MNPLNSLGGRFHRPRGSSGQNGASIDKTKGRPGKRGLSNSRECLIDAAHTHEVSKRSPVPVKNGPPVARSDIREFKEASALSHCDPVHQDILLAPHRVPREQPRCWELRAITRSICSSRGHILIAKCNAPPGSRELPRFMRLIMRT